MLNPLLAPNLAPLAEVNGIRHGFFTRAGGVSEGIYASLNCGQGSADDRDAVIENRARAARHLGGTDAKITTLHQVHSALAVVIDGHIPRETLPKADGVVTATPGVVIGALAADCAPVLFADPVARVIGAAHAGWRGALGGVIEATVAAMEGIGAARGRIVACVGPCIGADAYEVGPEFESAFIAEHAGHACYFHRPAQTSRAHFDLPRFVHDRLRETGIASASTTGGCTYAEPERFFSYRRTTHRQEGDYGRQISAIVVA